MPITERDLIIVTLAMDNAKAFSETRNSVESQSRTVLHYVFDSSSDTSIEDLCRNANALKYNRAPALGIYGTMNFVIKQMSLEIDGNPFILFLHSADSLANKDVVANILTKVDEAVDWFYCDYIVEDSTVFLRKMVKPENWSLEKQLFNKSPIHHQALFVRLTLLMDLGGFNEKLTTAADWEMICRLTHLKSGHYLAIPSTLFQLGGFSSINREMGNREILMLRKEFLGQRLGHSFLNIGFHIYRVIRLKIYRRFVEQNLSILRAIRRINGWR